MKLSKTLFKISSFDTFSALRSSIFYILYILGFGYFLKKFNQRQCLIPILLFHRVSNYYDPYTEPLNNRQFNRILKFLKNNYTIRPINDLYSSYKNDLTQSCFIVFDDGLMDFYSNSWNICKLNNVPVTLFIPTEPVSSAKIYWSLQLISSFINTKSKFISFSHHGNNYHYDLTINSKLKSFRKIHHYLLNLDISQRDILFNKIINDLGCVDSIEQFQMITYKILEKLINEGLDVQSHTKCHNYLPSVSDEVLHHEFSHSKKKLNNIRGISCNSVSYPYGGYNQNILSIAQKYYDYGYTTTEDQLLNLNKLKKNDIDNMRLPRINVTDSSPYELFFRINGFHSIIKRIIKIR